MTGNRPGTTPTKLNTWDKSSNSANRIDLSAVWQEQQLLRENQAMHPGPPHRVHQLLLTASDSRKQGFKSLPNELGIAMFCWVNSPRSCLQNCNTFQHLAIGNICKNDQHKYTLDGFVSNDENTRYARRAYCSLNHSSSQNWGKATYLWKDGFML